MTPTQNPPATGTIRFVLVVALIALALGAQWAFGFFIGGANEDAATSTAPRAAKHPVTIRQPDGPPRVLLPAAEGAGLATASCTTCHASRTPNRQTRDGESLKEFHLGLAYSHGNLTCLSCHNANNYDQLALADGLPVEYVNVMTLCGQCHGTQTRDYIHGAHGGMTGYWDLSRGPRQRNNCVDCHNPHSPAFPKMKPTFKPRDRFLTDQPRKAHD